jgi:hypothetical protein
MLTYPLLYKLKRMKDLSGASLKELAGVLSG